MLSYEVSRSHALWHSDFHHAKRRVLTAAGEWRTPILLGFLDDHSRLGCHLQWYLAETAEVFVHGLCQAFMKRGLPRSLMTDNGAAMTAGEVEEGLHRLGIVHAKTMAYSPYQNGKCEVWWNAVERRLMVMLEGVEPLTLDTLNHATIAWLERDYHRRVHREFATTPLTLDDRHPEGGPVAGERDAGACLGPSLAPLRGDGDLPDRGDQRLSGAFRDPPRPDRRDARAREGDLAGKVARRGSERGRRPVPVERRVRAHRHLPRDRQPLGPAGALATRLPAEGGTPNRGGRGPSRHRSGVGAALRHHVNRAERQYHGRTQSTRLCLRLRNALIESDHRMNRAGLTGDWLRRASPILGWKTGSTRSDPPALRSGPPICDECPPSSSCDCRAAVMASFEIATL